jgi:flagellar basal-body rod protein FlgC
VPRGAASVYQATKVQQTQTPDGGVSASLAATRPSYLLAYDPGSSFANVQGLVAQPNVDVATELVTMMQARAAFGASLAAFKAADGMTRSLFDLLA